MPHRKHHRCTLCGKDFETGDDLEEHVENRESEARRTGGSSPKTRATFRSKSASEATTRG